MAPIERWVFRVLMVTVLVLAILGLFLPAREVSVRLPQWLASVQFPLWLGTILLFMIGGGLGGIVAHMQRLQDGSTLGRLSWSDEVTRGLVISATGGMGGAFAAMFIMILDSKISKQQTPNLDDYVILTFVSTAFVSGYLGFRFLKSVAERFELLNAAKVEAKKIAEERVDQFLERSRTIDEALRQ